MFDENETIVLYLFLNGKFCSPYKYKTCVGAIKSEIAFKTTKNCCKKLITFHNFQ